MNTASNMVIQMCRRRKVPFAIRHFQAQIDQRQMHNIRG
jgi:hypothetical protein